MQYDPLTPIAVFLGPSLARHKAERLLPANYYPPVRMGDVYRLIATGVETIVIIDGVFHNTTPVWQREIVAAMDSGITVIGASSMGALRAAELDQLGMVGHGQIYAWYRDGVVDGDDEVALLHAEEALGYQAISEPLVNIRYTLGQAVERSVLTKAQADSLIDLAKDRFFGDRSYHLLLQSQLVQDLPYAQRCDLTDWLTENPVNLKQNDAIGALRYCAERTGDKPVRAHQTAPPFPRPVVDTAYPAFETLKRGILTTAGQLVDIHILFEELKKDPDLMATEHARCSAMFFLQEAARASDLSVPEGFYDEFRTSWIAKHVEGDSELWLRQVGLTADGFDLLVKARAIQAYVLQQKPESLGLAFADQRMVVEALAQWYARNSTDTTGRDTQLSQERLDLSARAVAGCLVTHWASLRGIHAPAEVTEQFIARWEQREAIGSREDFLKAVGLTDQQFRQVWSQQAMYQWMLEKGPAYFGYGTYSFPQTLMEDMQVTGAVRDLGKLLQQEGAA